MKGGELKHTGTTGDFRNFFDVYDVTTCACRIMEDDSGQVEPPADDDDDVVEVKIATGSKQKNSANKKNKKSTR